MRRWCARAGLKGGTMADKGEGWSFDDVPESGLGVALRPLLKRLEPLRGKG